MLISFEMKRADDLSKTLFQVEKEERRFKKGLARSLG